MSKHLVNISIDEIHSRAICTEIGERLRSVLSTSAPLTAKLAALVARLNELEVCESPSIIPSMQEETKGLQPLPIVASSAPIATDGVIAWANTGAL